VTKLTLTIAALLIVLGVSTYVIGVDGKHSATALIPAGEGLLLAIAGLIALKPGARMHAMHVAVLVGLVGLIAAIVAMIKRHPTGITLMSMMLMAFLSAVFVLFCVRSFVNARKARQTGLPPA